MSDKLEALSQPVAVVVNKYGDPEAFGERELKLLADLQKVPYNTNFYSQEYVTALLAALEEKDQELDKEGDILIDTQESMREWKLRANAAEQREEHLKASVDVLSAKNTELETGHSEAAKQINSWRNLAKQNIAEREKDIAALDASRQRNAELEQRLQQPMPKGFSHQDGAPHALLGTGDVMISHIKWADAQGIAFAPMPAGKAGIGVNVDADVAGKSSDEIGAVFVVKATSVQSLEVLKEAVQMAIDGFKAEVEWE